MKSPYDIILRPIITERSTYDAMDGKYTFEVARDATKTDVRKACEQLFDVKVLKVNTMNRMGKKKRMGVHVSRTTLRKALLNDRPNPQ